MQVFQVSTLPRLLFDFTVKGLAWHEVWNIIVVIVFLVAVLAVLLLHALVAFGELAKGREAVWPKLIEDSRHELCELLVFPIAVDREGI